MGGTGLLRTHLFFRATNCLPISRLCQRLVSLHRPRTLEEPAGHPGGFACYAGLHTSLAPASVVVMAVLKPNFRYLAIVNKLQNEPFQGDVSSANFFLFRKHRSTIEVCFPNGLQKGLRW